MNKIKSIGMNRFTRTTAALATALVLLVAATGCGRPKPGPGLPLDKQLDKIIAETGITQAHEISIATGYLTIIASYQGKPHDLSLENGELNASELTDSLKMQLRGSAPLSDFDASALVERYEQAKQSGNCDKPETTETIALTGAHVADMHCLDPSGDNRYVPGSTTVDGQPVIDSPDPFTPEDVTTLATDRAKVIPDNGAITTWELSFADTTQEFASLPRATTIGGGSCIPTLSTSTPSSSKPEATSATTNVYCSTADASDIPVDPNTSNPLTFRLSDYDPNLVNIVAQQIKEESDVDITGNLPSGSLLFFTPNPDGSNTITWNFSSIALGTKLQVTGTLTPIK